MLVELRDDLILPRGGTQEANSGPATFQKKNQSVESAWIYDQDQGKKGWTLSGYSMFATRMAHQDLFRDFMALANGRCTLMGIGKICLEQDLFFGTIDIDNAQTYIYHFICMILHFQNICAHIH